MGLDMYLEAKKYVGQNNWSNGEPTPNPEYTALVSLAPKGLTDNLQFGGASVALTVGYWRKANAIHGWFVDTLAGGVDECQEIYVPREKLVELRELCASVIKQPAMAGEILPPQSGFFFGSSEIDEWYLNDMQLTIDIIDKVLSAIHEDDYGWSFSYHASW
jgi:hypothetical protein